MDEKCFHSAAGWPQKVNLMINCHDHEVNSKRPFILPWPPYYASTPPPPPPLPLPPFNVHGFPSSSMSTMVQGIGEDPVVTSSSNKNHSQAEKRRRERINSHLSTLRRLIPRSDKMDKASLLGCVVDQVKELKRQVVEISQVLTIPSEFDEVTIADCDETVDPIAATTTTTTTTTNNNNTSKDNNNIFLRASVCCEDRPELLMELIEALKGLKLRTVRADMVTMGGRVVNVFILCSTELDKNEESSSSVCLRTLKQSLRAVLSRVIASSSSSSSSMSGFSSKRQRVLFPSVVHYSPHFPL